MGRFGDNIHLDPFLQSLRLVQSSHSSDGELYSPQLLLWLEDKPEARQADLERWLKQLKTLNDTVTTYLSLFREMATFETIMLSNGFYQCPLPIRTTSSLLIMLRMEKNIGLAPKMQIGHHGFSLRLCEMSSMREVQNQTRTVDLSICQL